MHFLGMAGMPRRISDYPDSYATLNYIASLGSMISVAATLLFFYIIIDALLVQKRNAATSSWAPEEAIQCCLSITAVSEKGDAAATDQLGFQTPATTIMEKIVDLHHDLMFFIIVVVVFVS